MSVPSHQRAIISPDLTYRSLKIKWADVSSRYLCLVPPDSLWRFNRPLRASDPYQGWKLHLSATILNAVETLELVGPLLTSKGVLFKAPVTLRDLARLNSGIFYGYSQVGKFITVYPRTTDEAVALAKRLDQLTRHLEVPSVPFDFRFRPRSNVYYRYGAFKTFEEQGAQSQYVIRDPNGRLVPDDRNIIGKPAWVMDPFRPKKEPTSSGRSATLLQTTFKAFRAVTQRGRGGVYQALDLSVMPPRLCILKEGRKHGEVEWDGRDGFWRIRHEEIVLKDLRLKGVNVPRIYDSFQTSKNYYLAVEHIDGQNIEVWLSNKKRRLSINAGLRLCLRITQLLSNIHRCGWIWRDCKPCNLIQSKTGDIRPIDFEGACQIDPSDPFPYGTSSYLPPEWDASFQGQSRLPEDLYAMGVVFYLVFAGRLPNVAYLTLEQRRKNIPKDLVKLVNGLLSDDPLRRPNANAAMRSLKRILRKRPDK